MSWLFPPLPERRLLPSGRPSGPTPWLIGVMSFVMLVVAAAGLMLAASARTLSDAAQHRLTVQIADGRQQQPAVVAALRKAPGVVSVEPVAEAELRRTLERWLGPVANDEAAGLPLPSLVEVELRPGSPLPPIIDAVHGAAPQAAVITNAQRLGPMLSALQALAWLAAAIVALIALATGAAVVLATRSAIEAQRATIEVMHGVGATDLQVAHLFMRRLAIDALVGALGGTLLASILLLLLGATGLGAAGLWTGGQLLSGADFLLLAALPFLAAALATLVARRTVLKALRERL